MIFLRRVLLSTFVLSVALLAFNCSKNNTDPVIPKLNTTVATNITQISASSGGTIVGNGGSTITANGICWATSSNPTISDSKTSDATGGDSFSSSMTGLTPNTKYYVRAYATNKIGTAYGNEITFTTVAIGAPVLTSSEAILITTTSAKTGGQITSDGGSTVTARGVCWSLTTGPTIADSKTTDGTGTGSFASLLSGLTPGTKYYVRAYATNSAGTSYGNEINFTTTATTSTLTTTAVSSIGTAGATSGGDISSDGGAAITARGVCWSTATGPTTADSYTSDGTGTGSFVSSIIGLAPKTKYYVRAYATNSVGTTYGNELSFTTQSIAVTIYDSKETTIFNNAAGNALNGDYGAGGYQYLQVGFSSSSSIYAHALVQFDVSTIPSNAVIDSVVLQFTKANSGSSVPTISVYKLTEGWSEGSTADGIAYSASSGFNLGTAITGGGVDATWNNTDYNGTTGTAWTTAGGTFNASASATSADTNASLTTFTSTGLAADVQAWVSGSSSNYGWILKIAEPTTGTGKIERYVSREGVSVGGAAATSQPYLYIKYH
jgi:hypothetical protein